MRLEIMPQDGGLDAEQFALELGQSIAKHAGVEYSLDGTTVILSRL